MKGAIASYNVMAEFRESHQAFHSKSSAVILIVLLWCNIKCLERLTQCFILMSHVSMLVPSVTFAVSKLAPYCHGSS